MPKILVLDDDVMIRNLLSKILELSGHEVHLAEDGATALELYRSAEFDLIITDLFMPDKEGLEVIRELRQENPDVKIIAISGGGSLDSMSFLEVARLIGAQHTLEKPFGPDELLEAIAEVLDG